MKASLDWTLSILEDAYLLPLGKVGCSGFFPAAVSLPLLREQGRLPELGVRAPPSALLLKLQFCQTDSGD